MYYRLKTSLTNTPNRDNFVTYSRLRLPFSKKSADVYLVNEVKKTLCV